MTEGTTATGDTAEGATTTDDDSFRLIAREWEKTEDGSYTVTETTYDRRAWVEEAGGPNKVWSTLAMQTDDGVELAPDEDLIAIRVMGFVDDDGSLPRKLGVSRNYDGPEWTLATTKRYTDVADPENEEYPGPPSATPPSDWAHDPVFEGWETCASFRRVKPVDDRERYLRTRYTFDYPKAAGLVVVRAEGTPLRVDEEPLAKRAGYPETERGFADRSAEWSFEAALAETRNRAKRAQQAEAHTADRSEIEALADTYDVPAPAAIALAASTEGERRYQQITEEDADSIVSDAVTTAAGDAVQLLLDGLSDDMRAAVVEDLADEEEELP